MHKRLRTGGREISQRSKAWQKEISTAAYRHELRQARALFPQTVSIRYRERIRIRTTAHRLAVPHQWVTLFTQTIKLHVHQPSALHKLELPRDVAVETNKVQPMHRRIRLICERIFRR